ncbi:uncharacterized protein PAC_02487 [Phialocephala subalpina]|uniref:Uncharacterized protein n=1 Tax=Phialocephala subalpina TaxID=576137 RepID=A0A1L7WIK9_9HELO|nr:uncharacterized protein PAC_02487 [Phialocephala subalpina]
MPSITLRILKVKRISIDELLQLEIGCPNISVLRVGHVDFDVQNGDVFFWRAFDAFKKLEYLYLLERKCRADDAVEAIGAHTWVYDWIQHINASHQKSLKCVAMWAQFWRRPEIQKTIGYLCTSGGFIFGLEEKENDIRREFDSQEFVAAFWTP